MLLDVMLTVTQFFTPLPEVSYVFVLLSHLVVSFVF